MPLAFWLMTPQHIACELAHQAGYDLVIFDQEHGTFTTADIERLLAFCRALGLAAYVRVNGAERIAIQQALDQGAAGVIIPQIQNLDHAREVTAFAKYPPLGTRGMGYSRIQDYGGADEGFTGRENEQTHCYAMIETPTALRDAEAIVALDTIDGLFLGPSDLSLTRGRGQNTWTEDDVNDARAVASAASGSGKLFATTGAENPTALALGKEVGAAFMTAGADIGALDMGFRQLLAMARGERT
ncbi:MAG: aldolase/citrate lyase family protein [Alphaproteobacteria bacterium]|jgi:4-hydroxy-2-oxoheptanedioate aldolase|nr:2,4-dihydroxyhept-2-ene-1,7-dioic acid aldolase [Rhodospirillaceae bacterium]MBT6509822.1 2,4-dihydroxyhept-2-ene-1,7-dioic acid aldolase [Rhodospirillaceae bacterium]MBT7612883.1 2,4-dihydroxyhept-2-ene-1,7-dioic acid aldolase [Rhodospirillaceae bacterium]MBT7647165.1 2,4-dihydroxyhept-2-ene-1,7-dioic acid aldolase [Rhodospirillaceae bacterium]MDG2481205.1 aldolase/citrate lyase family protein [Alphaproteobacteria bacterium]